MYFVQIFKIYFTITQKIVKIIVFGDNCQDIMYVFFLNSTIIFTRMFESRNIQL